MLRRSRWPASAALADPPDVTAPAAEDVRMREPMQVQIFGVRKSADTRKALRFFAERRITTHFVDFTVRAASPGELRRFAQRFGVEALLDRDGRRFADLGLQAAQYSEDRWLDRLAQEPLLLRVPLVRWGQKLTIGAAEDEWRAWLESTETA